MLMRLNSCVYNNDCGIKSRLQPPCLHPPLGKKEDSVVIFRPKPGATDNQVRLMYVLHAITVCSKTMAKN